MVRDTFNSLGQAIAIQVMLLVVEHPLWKTSHASKKQRADNIF
jgi:F0F1-type ATP synthase membrane subunit b/b'